MHLVIDGDSLIYAAGAYRKSPVIYFTSDDVNYTIMFDNDADAKSFISKNQAKGTIKYHETKYHYEPDPYAIQKIKKSIVKILDSTSPDSVSLYIGYGNNTQHKRDIYPHYKSNRTIMKTPNFVALRDFLVNNPKSIFSNMETKLSTLREADEDVCEEIAHLTKDKKDCVLASLDKDVLYLTPGRKYDFYKTRQNLFSVTTGEAIRYSGLLTLSGDASDNVPGVKGIAEPKFNSGELVCSGNTHKLIPENGLADLSSNREETEILATDVYKKVYKELSSRCNLSLSTEDKVNYIKRSTKLISLPFYNDGGLTNIYDIIDWSTITHE